MSKRAELSSELKAIQPVLQKILPILESQKDCYASIYFEKKSSTRCHANLKNVGVKSSFSMGAVLRIYDGYTLFEQGTDELSVEALTATAQSLAKRVASKAPAILSSATSFSQKRLYQAPTWSERLRANLDPVLRTQIPAGVHAATPVHFGVSYELSPREHFNPDTVMSALKSQLKRCQELAPQAGLSSQDLTYLNCSQEFREEESLFLDREVNVSQTLFRMALRSMCMCNADYTRFSVGGLGGMESLSLSDATILEALSDLNSLRTAEKLKPGRYRVVLSPVISGVLAHEAFGHSQEADTCARSRSKAWELHKTGERVGNEHATILNNPAIYKNGVENSAAWGSYFFDEEGWLAQSQTILDRGTLSTPMSNLTSALRLQIPRTANGKRESWTHGVYSRQTNTYFSAGTRTLAELMAQVKDGFLAAESAGGMEDPKGMGIQVGIQYLKEIRDGKLTGRVFKGPSGGDIQMTGYVPDVLNSIIDKSKIEHMSVEADTVAHPFNDLGGCGKYHKEFVMAGCGGPYMLLDNVILG